ncbi:MAG: hypothetical protein ACKVOW_00790, partial [Chitinophagaceae bacterium]
KRRFLLIIPLILLIGAAGYWLALPTDTASVAIRDKDQTNYFKNNSQEPSSIEAPEKNFNKDKSIQKTIQKIEIQNQPVLAIEKNSIKKDVNFSSTVSDGKKTWDKATSQLMEIEKDGIISSESYSQNESTLIAKSKLADTRPEKSNLIDKVRSAPVASIAQTEEKDSSLPLQEIKTTIIEDHLTNEVVVSSRTDTINNAIAITPPVINSNQTEVTQKKKPTINNKWQWGITATIGVGRIAQGGILNAFEKSLVLDASANGSNNQVPGSLFNLKPSALNSGANWSAGFFIQYKRSEKVQVSAGINYNYFSSHNEIGARVDSSLLIRNNNSTNVLVDDFYRNSSNSFSVSSYKSNYRFFELPVSLQLRLTKTNKLPFYWINGLSVGYLFSTNALHYDGTTTVYYKDNNLLTRTQVGFNTGFSFQLFSKSKNPLEVGPQFNYKLSRLLKSTNGDSRHLLSGGIVFKWYLKK